MKMNLNNIEMSNLFTIKECEIHLYPLSKVDLIVEEYIHKQCGITYESGVDVTDIEKEFRAGDRHLKFVRGKWLLWFFVEYVLNVHKHISSFLSKAAKPPQIHITFSHKNAVVLIAPRTRIPESLKTFIDNTYIAYINGYKRAST